MHDRSGRMRLGGAVATLKGPLRQGPWRRLILLGVLALVMLLTAPAIAYHWAYGQRVLVGVRVVDLDLGGHGEVQAREMVREWYQSREKSTLVLRHESREWATTLAEMGFTVDVERSAEAALAVGRVGALPYQWWTSLTALWQGHQVEPVLFLDQEVARRVLAQVASEIDRAPRDAQVLVDEQGLVRIQGAASGRALNLADNLSRLTTLSATADSFELTVDVVYPNVLEDQLREGQKALERLTSKPLVLEYEKASLTISPQELSSLVRPVGANPPGQGLLGYQVDLGRLRSMIEVWAKELEREPVDAKLSRSGLDFVLKESTIGVKVDVEATLAKVRERMGTDQRRLPLQVRLLHPRLTGAELVPVRELARRMVSEPLEIRYGQQKVMVPRERIAESITLVEETSGGRSFVRLALDEKKTLAMAEQAAEAFNRALKEGRFKLKDEKVFVLEEGQDGVQVRETETAKAIAAALLAGKHSLEPEMFVVSPSMSLPGKDRIDLSEKIIEASTSYAWSVPSKRHNIELAASRLDGTLVAPGQVFSFNKELGPTRLMDGFQMGYAIVFSGTQPITIPAEAGGICQVVTTLYHAVFWSGLRIVERWPHMYWIARYGERPLGRQGLDATVDSVSVDFKFQNNSPNWLAIRSWTEDQRVYFALFGRDPEFDVSLTGPVIERVVPADHTVVYEPHTSMKPGQQVQVESAMNGFDATITRRVTKDGVLIDEYVSKSHYSPARNVILVYPTPTPVVTPTPATTATPKPSPSVSPTPVPRFTPTAVSTPTPSPRR